MRRVGRQKQQERQQKAARQPGRSRRSLARDMDNRATTSPLRHVQHEATFAVDVDSRGTTTTFVGASRRKENPTGARLRQDRDRAADDQQKNFAASHQDDGAAVAHDERTAHTESWERSIGCVRNVDAQQRNPAPLTVCLIVNGTDLDMELETGAVVSLITEWTYKQKFSHVPMRASTQRLHPSSGDSLKVVGEITADILHGGVHRQLPLIVVHVEAYVPSLVGRNWLEKIRLNWSKIFAQRHSVSKVSEKDITSREYWQAKYPEVFADGLGTVTGMMLHIKQGAVPKFHQPRPVPFAVREAVEKELQRMEDEDIIEPVSFSEWATPLVCVPKADGSVVKNTRKSRTWHWACGHIRSWSEECM